MNREPHPSRTAFALLVSAFLIGNASGGCMDGGELQCEEAAARIGDCCGVEDLSAISCNHTQTSCGETFPAIGHDEALCIRAASCGELEALGVCAWAAALGSGTAGSLPGVCQ